jgi:hypothetical protein
MLLLAATALVASTPQNPIHQGSGPVLQARATVRIVSGVRLHWGERSKVDVPRARSAIIQTTAGPQEARLIEFE